MLSILNSLIVNLDALTNVSAATVPVVSRDPSFVLLTAGYSYGTISLPSTRNGTMPSLVKFNPSKKLSLRNKCSIFLVSIKPPCYVRTLLYTVMPGVLNPGIC